MWTSTEKEVSTCSTSRDAKDLTSVLLAISRGDPVRAASALTRALADSRNQLLEEQIKKQIRTRRDHTCDLIMEGIARSIKHHTHGRGSRTTPAETFVQNVCTACVFAISAAEGHSPSSHSLAAAIGTTPSQVGDAIGRATEMKQNSTLITALLRKQRKDFIREKVNPYVYDFLLEDSYT